MGKNNLIIKLNRQAVRELLRSTEMENICREHANRALSMLGDGYEASSMKGKNRANSEVAAVSSKARKENASNNTIMKAVSSS